MHQLTLATTPSDVMLFLRPILQPIYEALEEAAPKAFSIITENGLPNTAQLSSFLVRAIVKTNLDGRDCPIEYDDTSRTVAMESLSMEGLSTDYEGITLKVWKGITLRPAVSDPSRAFLQHTLSFWTADDNTFLRSLVVHWDCNDEGTNLKLWLSCPNGDLKGIQKWCQPIPHPSEWMNVATPEASPNDDFEDLLDEKEDDKEESGE